MMTCHHVREQLSLLVDGHLQAIDRDAVDAHLAACEGCRGVHQDLQRLTRAAAALGPIAPAEHVWRQVAGQLRLEPVSTLLPQVAGSRPTGLTQWFGLAAALVLVALSASYVLRTTPPQASSGNARATHSVEAFAEELRLAAKHYEQGIAELEAVARRDRDALDPVTTETLWHSIRTIDVAIEESREALTENPGSVAARESLFEALRQKVVVLQATVTLMRDMRTGHQAGILEATAAFDKKS